MVYILRTNLLHACMSIHIELCYTYQIYMNGLKDIIWCRVSGAWCTILFCKNLHLYKLYHMNPFLYPLYVGAMEPYDTCGL